MSAVHGDSPGVERLEILEFQSDLISPCSKKDVLTSPSDQPCMIALLWPVKQGQNASQFSSPASMESDLSDENS